MVICRPFAENLSCQKFKVCPDEHINVKQYVKAEMDAAISGHQWPLSCFGPFSDKPSVPNYIEDQSFEEIRFMYYNNEKHSFFESCQKFTEAICEAKEKMKMLNSMSREVIDVLINVYDYVEAPAKVKYPFEPNFKTNSVKSFRNSTPTTRKTFKGSFPPPPPTPVFQVFPTDSNVQKYNFGFTSPQRKNVGQTEERKDNESGFFSPEQQTNFGESKESVSCFFTSTHFLNLKEKQDTFSGFFGSEQLQKLQANAFGCKTGQEVSTQTTSERKDSDDYKEVVNKVNEMLNVLNECIAKSNQQQKDINSLTNSFKEIKKTKESNKMNNNTTGCNEPAIRIKPKFKQSSDKTKEEIKNVLSPFGYFNYGLQISTMLKSIKGSIVIRCRNLETVKKIEEEIKKSCAEHYSTERLKLPMPRILINGIDFEIDEDNLIEAIKKQNQIEGQMSLVRSFERGNTRKYSAVLQVDKELYWSIMRDIQPHLYIGWNKCIVYESIDVKRCYNCWGYNHHSRCCRNERRCPKCAGQHAEDECTACKLRCANCTLANLRLNLRLDLGHDARSYHCFVYVSHVERERKMIDY